MKTRIFFLSCLTFWVINTSAQAQASKPATGYWVVETNLHEAPYTIVKMYNLQNTLLYEERLEGKRLNIKRRRHVRMLNTSLNNLLKNTAVAQQGVKKGTLIKMFARL